jgi:hypothetical protein
LNFGCSTRITFLGLTMLSASLPSSLATATESNILIIDEATLPDGRTVTLEERGRPGLCLGRHLRLRHGDDTVWERDSGSLSEARLHLTSTGALLVILRSTGSDSNAITCFKIDSNGQEQCRRVVETALMIGDKAFRPGWIGLPDEARDGSMLIPSSQVCRNMHGDDAIEHVVLRVPAISGEPVSATRLAVDLSPRSMHLREVRELPDSGLLLCVFVERAPDGSSKPHSVALAAFDEFGFMQGKSPLSFDVPAACWPLLSSTPLNCFHQKMLTVAGTNRIELIPSAESGQVVVNLGSLARGGELTADIEPEGACISRQALPAHPISP